MNKLASYTLVIFGAFLYHLGHPNHFDFLVPFGSILGTALLLSQLLPKQNLKERIAKFLAFNLFITLVSFYWITKTLQEFGDLPFALALGANSLYTLIFQPHFWILIIVLHCLEKRKEINFNNNLTTFLAAIFLTVTEYYVPQQFPVFISHPLITVSEYLGLASTFGMPMFSFICYLIALELYRLITFKSFAKLNWIICIVFVLLNPITAHIQKDLNNLNSKIDGPKFNVRMVQPNISNFLKVESEQGGYASVSYVLKQYKDLTLIPFKDNEEIDLIIWPETAYPYPIETLKNNLAETPLPPIIKEIASATQSQLLIGGYDNFKEDVDMSFFMTEYNTAFFISGEPALIDTYHKQVLIPFGETLPFGPLNKWISSYIPNISFFAEGTKFPVFKSKGLDLITTICYELLKPEFMREYLNSLKSSPDVLVNLTNDSWYGNTLEPEQHLFLARWRAIEFNLPILRSTNTGITTLISSNGQEISRLEYGVRGNLDLSIPMSEIKKSHKDPTLFQRFGISLSFGIWFLCFIFHFMLLKFKHAKND